MNMKALLAAAALVVSASIVSAVDFVVVNTAPEGPGSLRQAILNANSTPGSDRIVFNIPGAGVQKIAPGFNYLPKITDAVTIDGYTQPGSAPNTLARGSNAVVLIQIDGANADGIYYQDPPPIGLWIAAPNCTIRGLMITRFSPFTSGIHCCAYSAGYGILAGDRTIIEGNFIGTDGSASTELGNKGAGIVIAGADYRIGGTSPAARNMIGGNGPGRGNPAAGIRVGSSTRGLIIGNHIGRYTPLTGSSGAGTEGARNDIGIVLAGTFTDTVIGGVAAASSNVISGNGIGISTAHVTSGSGGSTAVASGAIIQGNLIGAARDAATVTSGNDVGIAIYGSNGADNIIGGTAPGAGNLIGSNGVGIASAPFSSSQYPAGNIVMGNDFEGNAQEAIRLAGLHNQIGGLAANAGNRIHHNGSGITIRGSDARRNPILSNLIKANNGLGIDLGPNGPYNLGSDGPTSNDFRDADNGPNRLQNFPTITRVGTTGGSTIITAALNSAPSSTYTVQLFGDRADTQEHVLVATRTITTDANGAASFEVAYPAPLAASTVVGTATDGEGNTSELTPINGPVQLANISTRGFVGTDAKILIGGFIVRSEQPKKVGVRALGPSVNIANRLPDPYLEIYDNNGVLLAKNDDWKAGQQQEVSDSGLAPSSDVESAVIARLAPGNYTAQVSGVDGNTGVGVVEVYDLDSFPATSGRLVNISTRALVGTEDNILIGGLIVRGDAAARVAARAIGPDLSAQGVPDALQDPTLEMRDASGELIAGNDNWRENQNEPLPEGLQPGDDRDAALVVTVAPGLYTAIVRGKDSTTGVALVEFYDLKN